MYEAPAPDKRSRSIVKVVDEKPPCPVDKPPSLPREEIIADLDECKSEESNEVEEVEAENSDVPKVEDKSSKEEEVQIVKEEIIDIPIEPIIPKKKTRREKLC